MEITIGTQFQKQVNKKLVNCVVDDIVERKSLKTGKVFDIEYWAKSDEYGVGASFEVSKTTIAKGFVAKKTTI